MAEQNLILNIITFSPPKAKQDFSFYAEKKEGFYPIAKHEFPLNINDIIDKSITDTAEFLYTDFSATKDKANTITVDMLKCTRFAKHYYTFLINQYFRTKADITNSNFIHDNEVWFANQPETTKDWNAFTVYTVKVQINRVTYEPELVMSYDGVSKVLKQNLEQLDLDTTLFKRVVYDKKIYRYEEKPEAAGYDLANVFPVLNNPMKRELGFSTEPKYTRNKYLNYYNFVDDFFKKYINTTEFKKIIPLNGNGFLQVDKVAIKNTTPGSNLLLFGQSKTEKTPHFGMKNNGPFELAKDPHIKFIYIFHKSDKDFANEMKEWFKGKPGLFDGLKAYIKLNYSGDNVNSIQFESLENPFEEIRQQLSQKEFDTKARYIAIYISPFTKNETDEEKHNLYYHVKQELLKYSITSQVIDRDKMHLEGFKYYLPNIAIAILAKLNGVPWRLKRTIANELIVGVGAFKNNSLDEKYLGSAFCFSNDGHFKGFDCYSASDTFMLAGSISKAVRKYRSENTEVKRLVIHFYKTMGKKELEPIETQLKELGLDIPVIIITVNKTESKDLVIFDSNHKELIPISGTFICIGRNDFLLCNNTRYGSSATEKIEGFPFPIRIKIASTDKTVLEDGKAITDLIDQVYQFSRMYWKSVKQQNLPVTIKYPEMVAEIFPYFENKSIPSFGRDNLWFL
jgi:hypothetical protein